MSRILVATTNPGKVAEYQAILSDTDIQLLGLREVGVDFEVDESGQTFEENARLKARVYADASGLLTLADDSGLCVDALGGAPGIFSARYGPDPASRIERLLVEMADVPDESRIARFVCIIALAEPGGGTHTFEGVCEGRIDRRPKGTRGFGYDPVFYLPEYDLTMAELPLSLKNEISHRARAAARLKAWLVENSSQP
ncbi:MAG TPA: RdgB/HAM1 family non-canonical purine NTP pyrophosphatase [Anaerolineae bacterium]|nr:RdgB/HAM1 family non-canonical purine NTP pyrophosphatase [Anaerolineae bacterium]